MPAVVDRVGQSSGPWKSCVGTGMLGGPMLGSLEGMHRNWWWQAGWVHPQDPIEHMHGYWQVAAIGGVGQSSGPHGIHRCRQWLVELING